MLESDRHKKTASSDKSSTLHARRRSLESFLRKQMRTLLAIPGRTKRTAARLALVAAIREGHLGPGARLPPETALTEMLRVSLGTTQAALRQLQQTGTIVRRRGDGTRVASAEPLSQTVWHFRFLDKTTLRPIRFQAQDVEISATTAPGPWSDVLAAADSYIRIARYMRMSDGSRVFAEMFLDQAHTSALLATAPEELDMINIRPYLEETFGLETARARHIVRTTTLAAATARALGLEPATTYYEIHAHAFSGDGTPVYFQRIYAKSSHYALDF